MKKLFSIISVFVILILVALTGAFFSLSKAQNINEQNVFYSDQLSNVNEIDIESMGSISITSSNSDDLKVSLSGEIESLLPMDTPKLICKIEAGTLLIKDSSLGQNTWTIGSRTLNLNIDLPKNFKNKISIKSKSNPVNISNINSNDIECLSNTGNIQISTKKILGDINVKTRTGNIDLTLPEKDKFRLSSNSRTGTIQNNLSENVDNSITDKTIDLSSDTGSIVISK